MPMSLAVSVAAICFPLLIATLVRMTEQAAMIGGVSSSIFAVTGGVMLPTYVMLEVIAEFCAFIADELELNTLIRRFRERLPKP